jgi:hypothetical protein
MDDKLEFFAWGWIGDAFWHFGQAFDSVGTGLRCLWWALCSLFEYVWAWMTERFGEP